MFRRLLPILLLIALIDGRPARGTTFLTLQSTYLGDGWFQYQMNVMDDPFFLSAHINQVAFNFTNQIDYVTKTNGWSFDPTNQWQDISNFPARPFTETFLMRSSDTSWRLSTNSYNGVITFSVRISEFHPLYGGHVSNIVGYALTQCLVPCTPEEADGSPTNYLFTLKLLPDVTIDQLVQTNGNIYGINFTWDSESTFLLQGSTNFNDWENITYLWSYPPQTMWTTNVPLNDYGQFYRIEIVANGHSTNLPALTSSAALTSNVKTSTSTGPVVTGCQINDGKVLVNVAAQAGQTVQVQAIDSNNKILQTQTVTAQGTLATAIFDSKTLPAPVYFQAVAQ